MAGMARGEPFKTPVCRFSYVQNMFKRVARKDDAGRPVLDKNEQEVTEQQCTLIFDKATTPMDLFQKAILEVLTAQWGENAVTRFKNGLIRTPILAGDGKEARNSKTGEIHPGLGADKFFIRVATRLEAPIRYKSALIPPKLGNGPDEIKSGDYGFAVLAPFAWNNTKNGDGISFGIEYLQKLYDGESLGGVGGVDPEKYYQAIEPVAGAAAMNGASADSLFS